MPTDPKHLRQMIADQKARDVAYAQAAKIARDLRKEVDVGFMLLRNALVEASGYAAGHIKTINGRELKIGHIRLNSDCTTLSAACYDRTKSGEWSKATRATVRIAIKGLGPDKSDPMHPDNCGFDGPGGAE